MLYRFTDTQPRIYVDRALEVAPGDEVDWPDGPPGDGQWEPVDGAPTPATRGGAAQSSQKTTTEQPSAAASGE